MKLFVAETGIGNKETLIFLHAEGISGWMWDEQVKYFENYHCMIPDLPEHGRSGGANPFTIQNSAEIVSKLIDNSANGKANLAGIGLGGQIILQIISNSPEKVDHALVSGALVKNNHHENLIKHLKHLLMVYKPVKNDDFFIKAYMRTYNMPKIYFDKFKQSTHQIEGNSIERILMENQLFEPPKCPETSRSKLLVLAGEKDCEIIKDSSRKILNRYSARGALALGGGHLWNMEYPKNFNAILEAWLKDEPLPEAMISRL